MKHVLIEFDLAGAEWVVVAYMAGDANMLDVVASGKSPHVVTGSLMCRVPEDLVIEENKLVGIHTDPDIVASYRSRLTFPVNAFLPRSMSIRQAGKKSNHGLNYFMRYKRFAFENEMPETDAKPIVEAYSTIAYPGIQTYWDDTRTTLKKEDRCLVNPFGRKVRLMGEWGVDLFMAAYAFRPQSTVFDVCRTGMIRSYKDGHPCSWSMKMGAQVHDSLMAMYPSGNWEEMALFCQRMIYQHMRVPLGITDPHGVTREMVLGVDAKVGHNWGEMQSVKVTANLEETAANLQAALTPAEDKEAVVSEEPEWSQVLVPDFQAP